jgi:hypothetical protein
VSHVDIQHSGLLVTRTMVSPGPAAAPAVRVLATGRPFPELAANDPINWWLIGAALVYVAMSYFLLVPSIWLRLVLASLLILRMRADIIIPLCLSCLQLKLNFQESMSDVADIASGTIAGLTGFESYAFAIPPLLISVRTAFALPSTRTDRRGFPTWLYAVWLFGGAFIVVGAFVNLGTTRGWTGGMRMYSIVGCLFYGLLMPRPSLRQIDRLAGGLAAIGMILYAAAATGRFSTKILFVLAPICIAWGVTGVLGPVGIRSATAALMLAVTSVPILVSSTFTVFGTWLWSGLAAVLQCTTRPGGRRLPTRMVWMVIVSAVVLSSVFLFGLTRRIGERSIHDSTMLGRMEWKLYADRSPLWWGCIKIISEEPSLLPTPERPFMVEWFGVKALWEFGPHNLVLELLNQLGVVAGFISIVVLVYFVGRCVVVLTQDRSRGVQTLAIATIGGIMVGGLTLPYMIQDRIAEYLLIATAVALSSSMAARSVEAVELHGRARL